MSSNSKEVVLVVGGGFLGRWICEKLLESGYVVKVFDLRKPFDDDRISEFINGDLNKSQDLENALKGVESVIHTASPPYDSLPAILHKVNVNGTKNLLEQCKKHGIKRFVFTSTGSLVANGVDIIQGDESLPYATNGLDGYATSKALAEKEVLKANDPKNGFYSCALRVCGLFGPRDVHFIPTLVTMGKKGQSKYSITNVLFDWTYIENAADSHILALKKLTSNPELIGGQSFFITNDDPVPVFQFFSLFWRGFGYPTPKIHIPVIIVLYFALIFEWIRWILSPIVKIETNFTYFRIWTLSASRVYSIAKAKKILDYKPKIDVVSGVNKTIAWFKTNRPDLFVDDKNDSKHK